MPADFKADKTLDCIGLYCPEPVFQTRMELDKMATGEILEVIADDLAAEEDIKNLAKWTGHEILKLKKDGNVLHFLIKKGKGG